MRDQGQLLTSKEMAQFVSAGFLRFDGLVPDELNREAMPALEAGFPRPSAGTPLPLAYAEDSVAQVDMNVVMSSEGGFVEVQGTGEHGTFDRGELQALLDLAVKGLRELDAAQRRVLGV